MKKGELLLRFCADRVGWALEDHRPGQQRRAFLGAFAACDASLDGLAWMFPDGQTKKGRTR